MSVYPEFEAIRVQHQSLLNDALRRCPPEISEFTFTNLYSWRKAYKFFLSILDDFIIIRSGREDKPEFFDPIGKGDKKKVISKVFNDFDAVFIRLPEATKALFDHQPVFKIEQDLDNCDYLYNASDLVALAGSKYDGKRNLIKRFQASNKYEYIELEESNVKEALQFEQSWCTIKNCDTVEGLNNERTAIREMLNNFSSFKIIGGAIRINNDILAIALGEMLNPATLVMHVLKADPNITGLYQALLHEFLLRQRGEFEYINLEQDLGVEGLRKAKQSYHPCRMVNKYSLELR